MLPTWKDWVTTTATLTDYLQRVMSLGPWALWIRHMIALEMTFLRFFWRGQWINFGHGQLISQAPGVYVSIGEINGDFFLCFTNSLHICTCVYVCISSTICFYASLFTFCCYQRRSQRTVRRQPGCRRPYHGRRDVVRQHFGCRRRGLLAAVRHWALL